MEKEIILNCKCGRESIHGEPLCNECCKEKLDIIFENKRKSELEAMKKW